MLAASSPAEANPVPAVNDQVTAMLAGIASLAGVPESTATMTASQMLDLQKTDTAIALQNRLPPDQLVTPIETLIRDIDPQD